ncbi:MAG: leucine-rich repeat domain-containing protein [Anaeroplasmataceae bacterium]
MKKVILFLNILIIFLLSSCTNNSVSNTWSYDENSHWHNSKEGKSEYEFHSFSDWCILKEQTNGTIDVIYRECMVCGYCENDTKSHEHEYKLLESKEVTCQSDGYDIYECYCGLVIEKNKVIATGHSSSEWILLEEPTKVKKGTLVKKCESCDECLDTIFLPPLNEEDYEYEVVSKATCSNPGYEIYKINIADKEYVFNWESTLEHEYDNKGICINCNYESYNDFLFNYISSNNAYEIIGLKNKTTTNLIIPEKYLGLDVIGIAKEAFKDNTSILNVWIPDTIKRIGSGAFYGCSQLRTIRLSENVTALKSKTFYGCIMLRSITIPSVVTQIDSDVFEGCSKIKEVYNLSYVDIKNPSIGCNVYTSLNIESGFIYKGDYIFYDDGIKGIYLYDYIGNESHLNLPSDIDGEEYHIYKYAFYNNDTIKSVNIPDNVNTICLYAFRELQFLNSITLCNTARIIEKAYYGCNNLKEVYFKGSLEEWETHYFSFFLNVEKLYLYDRDNDSWEMIMI